MNVDVLVVGTGPAAVAAVMTLHKAGAKVVFVDNETKSIARLETLSNSAMPTLTKLGLSDCVKQASEGRNTDIASYWGSKILAEASTIGLLGGTSIIDRKVFDIALKEKITESQHIPGTVKSVGRSCDSFSSQIFTAAGMTKIRSKYVLDASGHRSALHKQFGIERLVFDKMICVSLTFEAGRWQRRSCTSIIESFPFGWCFSIKGRNGSQISFFLDAPGFRDLNKGNVEDVGKFTANRSGDSLPRAFESLRNPLSVSTCSASSMALRSIQNRNFFVCGDAAESHDPLSSKGMVHALDSGYRTALAIIDFENGDAATAKYLEHQRKGEFSKYLQMRSRVYALEKRWSQSSFWVARRNRSAVKSVLRKFLNSGPSPARTVTNKNGQRGLSGVC